MNSSVFWHFLIQICKDDLYSFSEKENFIRKWISWVKSPSSDAWCVAGPVTGSLWCTGQQKYSSRQHSWPVPSVLTAIIHKYNLIHCQDKIYDNMLLPRGLTECCICKRATVDISQRSLLHWLLLSLSRFNFHFYFLVHNGWPPCVDCETTCVCRHQRSRPRPRSPPPGPPTHPTNPLHHPPHHPIPTWNRPSLSMSNVSIQKYGLEYTKRSKVTRPSKMEVPFIYKNPCGNIWTRLSYKSIRYASPLTRLGQSNPDPRFLVSPGQIRFRV